MFYKLKKDIIWREIEDEIVIFQQSQNFKKERIMALNPSASFLFKNLINENSENGLYEIVESSFKVENKDNTKNQINSFLYTMNTENELLETFDNVEKKQEDDKVKDKFLKSRKNWEAPVVAFNSIEEVYTTTECTKGGGCALANYNS